MRSFPEGIWPYIKSVIDVAVDGHCGFRAIVGLMGFGEDNWAQVRENLVYELDNHGPSYEQVYGSSERVQEIRYLLSYFNDNALIRSLDDHAGVWTSRLHRTMMLSYIT